MSQSLIRTDIGKMIRDTMKGKSDTVSTDEVFSYIVWLCKHSKVKVISREEFDKHIEKSIYK